MHRLMSPEYRLRKDIVQNSSQSLSPATEASPEAVQKSKSDKTSVDSEVAKPSNQVMIRERHPHIFLKGSEKPKRRSIALTQECSQMVQGKIPQKMKDLGTFIIPCIIGDVYIGRALCDLGASINLMPFSVFKKLGIGAATEDPHLHLKQFLEVASNFK
ncbi:hypothetical protein A2U01_0031923, partial [Trifolium medium]|nr:hypothetical protein [Trifolium medium]